MAEIVRLDVIALWNAATLPTMAFTVNPAEVAMVRPIDLATLTDVVRFAIVLLVNVNALATVAEIVNPALVIMVLPCDLEMAVDTTRLANAIAVTAKFLATLTEAVKPGLNALSHAKSRSMVTLAVILADMLIGVIKVTSTP